ncbi:hypothetical protein BKA61DRAFT_530667, partial [Leptodontidium sp. MPI-SDFR-AT-0119]
MLNLNHLGMENSKGNVEEVKTACEGIEWITPSSSKYEETRRIYQQVNSAVPLAILRPRTVGEVAQIVNAAVQYDIKFTVRSGGHHIMGLCIVENCLVIDIRYLNNVEVAADKKSAIIGGGASNFEVACALEAHGLVTPQGLVKSVGFVGWATFGGYGNFMNHMGLGVDSIIGAQVVTWDGKIVEAADDLLKGIRGAGGTLGIITSIKVKTYTLEKVLAGGLIFDVKHFTPFLKLMQENALTLPPALQVGTAVFNFPPGKRTFRAEVFWSSPDLNDGWRTIQHLLSISPPVLINDISETKVSDMIMKIDKMVPPNVYGGNETVSFERFDDDVLDVLEAYVANMPWDPATVLALHHLSPISPSARSEPDHIGSLWAVRRGHTMLELIGSVEDRTKLEESRKWTIKLRDDLRAAGKALEETYLSMTYPGDRTLAQVYGTKWAELQKLKEKYDPNGVFDLAVPWVRT